jgi:hypothetical protein
MLSLAAAVAVPSFFGYAAPALAPMILERYERPDPAEIKAYRISLLSDGRLLELHARAEERARAENHENCGDDLTPPPLRTAEGNATAHTDFSGYSSKLECKIKADALFEEGVIGLRCSLAQSVWEARRDRCLLRRPSVLALFVKDYEPPDPARMRAYRMSLVIDTELAELRARAVEEAEKQKEWADEQDAAFWADRNRMIRECEANPASKLRDPARCSRSIPLGMLFGGFKEVVDSPATILDGYLMDLCLAAETVREARRYRCLPPAP